MAETCGACGGEVSYCSLCKMRMFHVSLESIDSGELVGTLHGCPRCDLMLEWPLVARDPLFRASIVRMLAQSR